MRKGQRQLKSNGTETEPQTRKTKEGKGGKMKTEIGKGTQEKKGQMTNHQEAQ